MFWPQQQMVSNVFYLFGGCLPAHRLGVISSYFISPCIFASSNWGFAVLNVITCVFSLAVGRVVLGISGNLAARRGETVFEFPSPKKWNCNSNWMFTIIGARNLSGNSANLRNVPEFIRGLAFLGWHQCRSKIITLFFFKVESVHLA